MVADGLLYRKPHDLKKAWKRSEQARAGARPAATGGERRSPTKAHARRRTRIGQRRAAEARCSLAEARPSDEEQHAGGR
jgi:hypothetical protein